ncbi:MAG: protein kinase [Candidatus Saccharibacteria bacterium]|nr:protein kinase [Rhodoferax sp.]
MMILVVEDEASIRDNVVRILRMEGFEVLEAENGQIGLDLARANRPDLVLSDVMMPQLDGHGLLEALRAHPNTALVPFIFLSARTDRTDVRKGMNLGADDYIGKPFSRDELMDAVWARIKRTQALGLTKAPAEASQPAAENSGLAPVGIKGYRMLKRLGSGGMSEVFLAVREHDGLEVALKILDTRKHTDTTFLHRFIQEYALLEQINHPNVARIFDHGFTDEQAFISMEYFSHGDIRQRMVSGLSPLESLAVVLQVARALSQIHALGIVHRDVKPDNLMLRANGSVALIDFGVAKHSEQKLEQTRHGEIVGSPYYMSPEQADGKPVGPASDIYSLGVILYEMISRQRPFMAETLEQLLYKHIHAPPPLLEAKFAEFQELLDRALHKDPTQRFASGQEVADYIGYGWPAVLRLLDAQSAA